MAKLTWLHLSDWHQKGPDFDRQVVRDALIRDIRRRSEIDPSLAQIDFVVFSGDLAFSGKSEEYEAAQGNLLDPVLKATDLKAELMFFVPGNHDMDRDTVYEMLPLELQEPLDSDQLVQKWLIQGKRQARTLEPFEEYREFVSGYAGQPTPDYATILRFEVNSKRIALLGINSAWMCARNRDAHGQVNDYGYTLVGEPQIHTALSRIADADLRIAVMHHPFDWLTGFDRNHVEPRLIQACHFILRGHEHKPKVQVVSGTAGDCIIIPAGASYKRRSAKDQRYTNAYNCVHMDLDAGQGMVYLRRWSDPRNAWIEDDDTYPSGHFPIKLLPKGLGENEPGSPTVMLPRVDSRAADAQRLKAAEKRYRELLLETCDIISLANLPEQDRHIVQKQRELKLRGLYIPLRVWVEASAAEEANEPGHEEKLWEALEKRRAAAMRGKVDEAKRGGGRQRVSVGERLAQCKRLVILGDPGAGKTTLTRWIATAYLLRLKQDADWKELPDVKTLPDADWLPIIVRCRELDQDPDCLGGTLNDLLKHTLRKAELSEAEATDLVATLREKLEAGQALLMLDGLDEIAAPTTRACLCQQLEQIVVACPSAPIIATSRIVGYREMGYKLSRGFEHLTLADLVSEEKDDFARRWCALTEVPERIKDATEELIHDIHSAERIERLTGNPMLLTTMALVKRKIGKLPSRRADLYWEAVQVLLNWRREVDEPLDVREAIPQLEYLAYAMCDRGVQQLRRDEVLELFGRMREEYPNVHAARNRPPEGFLKRLEARTGILIEAGHTRHLGMLVPVYEFRHLTFQEYLAARALVDGRFPERDPSRRLADHVAPLAGRTTEIAFTARGPEEAMVVENWREALRLCVAICSDDDVDALLLAILKPLENEPLPTARARATLAALCLADEPNASEQVVEYVLQEFAAQVGDRDGTGPAVTTGIDAAAIELAGTRWAGTLCTALVSEFCGREIAVRWNAGGLVATVGSVNIPQDEAELTDWLAEQKRRIHNRDEKAAIEAVLCVMGAACERKAKPIPGLVDILLCRLSGSAPMAHAAAWALGWLEGGPAARAGIWQPTSHEIESILAFVGNPNSDAYAVRFLTWVLANERVERAIEPLAFWLGNPIADVRRAAGEALVCIGSDTAVAPLIARLGDSESFVRSAAVEALGSIGSEEAVAPLIARLEDGEADVRSATAEALGSIGGEEAVAPLIARLEDGEAKVRSAVAYALGEIGSEEAVAPLIARLEDGEAKVHRAAAYALGEIKSDAAVAPLIARLEDGEAEVRSAAAEALGEIKSDAAVEPLIARLEDGEAEVRSAAAYALGEIKSDAAVEPLLAMLEDGEAEVRSAAAYALGEIGSEEAVAPLIARLEDGEAEMRRAAAGVLGKTKSDAAIAPLIARLEDGEADVRSAAARALGEIGSEEAVEPLIAQMEDGEANVRSAAAEALGSIGSEEAVALLIARLEDSEAYMRRAAAYALGEIKSTAAVEPLLAALEDGEAYVRNAAAEALGEIKSNAAVEPLIARLEDSEAEVHRAAAYALGSIGSDAAVAPLLTMLEDSRTDGRRAAVGGLAQGLEGVDRKLLSRDLDGLQPFLDPHRPIRKALAQRAASRLALPLGEVQARYEALSERFHLRLGWQSDQ